MPSTIETLDALFARRDAILNEIKQLESTIASFRRRYEDWAAEAAKTQKAQDIQTRDESYKQWKERADKIEILNQNLASLNSAIDAAIKATETGAISSDELNKILKMKSAVSSNKTLGEVSETYGKDKTTKYLTIGVVIIVVVIVGLILLKRFKVF